MILHPDNTTFKEQRMRLSCEQSQLKMSTICYTYSLMRKGTKRSAILLHKHIVSACATDIPWLGGKSKSFLLISTKTLFEILKKTQGREDLVATCDLQECEISSHTTSLATCATCGVVHYCSKEHQKKHWPMHKQRCQKSPLY
jgi:hypothetical protein